MNQTLKPLLCRWMPVVVVLCCAVLLAGCGEATPSARKKLLTFGVSFETLQTGFWVASLEAFKRELGERDIAMIQAIC
jgi:hypothetical protein